MALKPLEESKFLKVTPSCWMEDENQRIAPSTLFD